MTTRATDPATPAPTVTPAPSAPVPVPWVRLSRAMPSAPADRPVRARRVLLQLLTGLLVVLAVVVVLGSLAAQRLAEREAVTDAAATADVLATSVVAPALTDALADGDPAAVAAFDEIVRERVLGVSIVRVKLWSPAGVVLYADEPQLIGRTFALEADQRAALADPQTRAEISDLDEQENEFETGGRLLEVYRPVWAPGGRQLLFETYSPYESVRQRSSQLWRGFAGVMVSSLLLLVVLMVPILRRLLRRLAEAQGQRERMLERTVDASDAERRRIAGTLHDGPVQDLVASAFAAAGSAGRARTAGDGEAAERLDHLAGSLRSNIRVLRSLLVDIYPPTLAGSGLPAALADLAESARQRGVTVRLDAETDVEVGLTDGEQRLAYRVAQECLRNTARHASPCTATVTLAHEAGSVVLDLLDDGAGFDPAILAAPREGHFGMRVLGDLASDAGASLDLATAPGSGTHWRLTLRPVSDL